MKLPLRRIRLAFQIAMSCCAMTGGVSFSQRASAQQVNLQKIRADNTLPIATDVRTTNNQTFTIDGGTRLGDHLFHSFEQFSVPAQGEAVFNNSTNVANIIGRITGTQSSIINGLVQVNGTNTNLFLLNRNGVIFGPDAELKLTGSFVASTAESLRFTNGTEFVSNSTPLNPLLRINIPTGLQLGAASEGIAVSDDGYTLLSTLPLTVDSSSGLRVNPGRTLALIGSNIAFDSGVVATPGGHVEIGGVREGVVAFDDNRWRFDYDAVEQFGNITFSARSLIDTSSLLFDSNGAPYAFGTQGGRIQLQGDRIRFEGMSQALIQNYGTPISGNIRVIASDMLQMTTDTTTEIGRDPGITTTSLQSGAGGHIEVVAPQIVLKGDVSIGTDTFGSAPSGNVTITAESSMRFESQQETMPEYAEVNTISYAKGAAGNLNISVGDLVILGDGIISLSLGDGVGGLVEVTAHQIELVGGGNISSNTLAGGQGGDVDVVADTIRIGSINTSTFIPSLIEAATTGMGNAGKVTVNARQIQLQEGGRIGSSSLAQGNAGSVTVNASELVTVAGTVPGSINPSLIISAANIVDPALRAFFESIGVPLSEVPTGDSGNVTISTPNLEVTDGAQITARNDGTGNAGTLTVNAESVYLSDRAGITASTQQGSGGDAVLNIKDYLLLRRGSYLSAAAGGNGDGGNVTLNVPVVIALENSDITASAIQGAGGNIQIIASTILGTAFRDQLTAESDITASSEFGVSGEVEISSLEGDLSSGAIALPEDVADSSDQVAAGCSKPSVSQFVASGRGGLPPNPTSMLQSTRLWSDLRIPSSLESNRAAARSGNFAALPSEQSLVEAVDWLINAQGQVALIQPEDDPSSIKIANGACL